MTAEAVESRYGPVVMEVESSRTARVYQIREKDGAQSCNCPGYAFRKSCKHIAAYVSNQLADRLKPSTIRQLLADVGHVDGFERAVREACVRADARLTGERLHDMVAALRHELTTRGLLLVPTFDPTRETGFGVRRIILED